MSQYACYTATLTEIPIELGNQGLREAHLCKDDRTFHGRFITFGIETATLTLLSCPLDLRNNKTEIKRLCVPVSYEGRPP